MSINRRRSTSSAVVIRPWISVLLCSAWYGIPGSSNNRATAFVISPTTSPQLLRSCSGKLGDAGESPQHTCARNNKLRRRAPKRRTCCMLSSEATQDVTLKRDVSRVTNLNDVAGGRFLVYNGPEDTSRGGRKLTEEQQAKKDREQELGTSIQRLVQLQKIRKDLAESAGGMDEDVSEEEWAEAAGETVESLRSALDSGASAKQALVVMNLGMVYNIVSGYVRSSQYAEFTKTDLVQEATMGLIRAVEKFDPARGFRFATYGQWWVRKYLNECVQNQNRMIRIPVSLAYRISKVNRIKNQLHLELGRAPTKSELASEAGCTIEQINACLEQGSLRVSSLDHITGFGRVQDDGRSGQREEGSLNVVDLLAAGGRASGKNVVAAPEGAEVLQLSLREDLSNAFFRLLDATERECLVLRYGLQDGVSKSVEETAEIMDFCDSDDVRIITSHAMSKLREGCLPEERKKLMSYLSLYEPEILKERQEQQARLKREREGQNDGSRGSSTTRETDDEDDVADEKVVWDFSNHGPEELQHELKRYLRKHRINNGKSAGREVKWSKGALAKGYSRRKKQSKFGSSSNSTSRNRYAGKFEAETPKEREDRIRKADRRREVLARQREIDEQQGHRVTPISASDEAGSALIGDLEPKPNSREADQLEHLSRLLWDGKEEPADFALSYGQRNRHL